MNNEEIIQHYQSTFLARESQLPGYHHPWVNELRRAAMKDFATQAFPSVHEESWKYARLSAFKEIPFGMAAVENKISTALLKPWHEMFEHTIVFVNGHYSPALSRISNISGLVITPLSEMLKASPAQLQKHWMRASRESHAFRSLNTAFMSEGIYVHVLPEVKVSRALHVMYVTTQPHILVPLRKVFFIASGAVLEVVETYIGDAETTYFTNAVSDIILEERSQFSHVQVLQESASAFHCNMQSVHQEKHSQYQSQIFASQALFSRHETHVDLAGEKARCELQGIYAAAEQRYNDHHLVIDHQAPHTQSHTLYKGIASEQGRTVFNGKIKVKRGAHHTDARLVNRNLQLSPTAEINTRPQLEIDESEVQCTHGATVGQLDAEALFYLQSRGIPPQEARALLVHAFMQTLIDDVKHEALRKKLNVLFGGKVS